MSGDAFVKREREKNHAKPFLPTNIGAHGLSGKLFLFKKIIIFFKKLMLLAFIEFNGFTKTFTRSINFYKVNVLN